jgi:hypothetical protein
MPTADGSGERPTTIRDAKRLGLYPSVTSILGVLAKPGLEKWKLDQVALACLRTPKQAEESKTTGATGFATPPSSRSNRRPTWAR